MIKSYRLLVLTLLVVLAAGFAHAEKITSSAYPVLTHQETVNSPDGRAVYVLTYDFTAAPISYDVNGIQFGFEGILPSEASLVAFGWTDLTIEVYDNEGPTYANWASDLFVGCTYEDDGLSFVGARPFEEEYASGSFGPVSEAFIIEPGSYYVPASDPFSFYASSNWDDMTDLPAGTITGGVLSVSLESPIVDNETSTLGALKAMYR